MYLHTICVFIHSPQAGRAEARRPKLELSNETNNLKHSKQHFLLTVVVGVAFTAANVHADDGDDDDADDILCLYQNLNWWPAKRNILKVITYFGWLKMSISLFIACPWVDAGEQTTAGDGMRQWGKKEKKTFGICVQSFLKYLFDVLLLFVSYASQNDLCFTGDLMLTTHWWTIVHSDDWLADRRVESAFATLLNVSLS